MYLWDEANIGHLALHEIQPSEAEQVLSNRPLEMEKQIRNDEERILYLGATKQNRILFVVVTPRDGGLRVVTGYPAKKAAREYWSLKRG